MFLIILKWNVKLIWFILLKNHIKRYVYTTKLRKLIVKLQRQLVSKIYNYKTKPKVQQKCVKINYSHFNVNLTKRVCIILIKTLYLILDCSLLYFRISFILTLFPFFFKENKRLNILFTTFTLRTDGFYKLPLIQTFWSLWRIS